MISSAILSSMLSSWLAQTPCVLGSLNFSIFEFGMLLCFGLSWPVSVYKSVKSKRTEGKSLAFMIVVWTGYLFGVTHKLLYSCDWVIILYLSNLTLVFIDITLYLKYSRRISPPPATLN